MTTILGKIAMHTLIYSERRLCAQPCLLFMSVTTSFRRWPTDILTMFANNLLIKGLNSLSNGYLKLLIIRCAERTIILTNRIITAHLATLCQRKVATKTWKQIGLWKKKSWHRCNLLYDLGSMLLAWKSGPQLASPQGQLYVPCNWHYLHFYFP